MSLADRPGAELSEAYFREVVAPLLARHRPGPEVAAARLGSGSDVLGFDDVQSRDHDWGLRLTLLPVVGSSGAERLAALQLDIVAHRDHLAADHHVPFAVARLP